VIPHGLYDLALNEGYLHLGDSHDTSVFAADAVLDWWRSYSRRHYPHAADLLFARVERRSLFWPAIKNLIRMS
jgi:hypothetical protein